MTQVMKLFQRIILLVCIVALSGLFNIQFAHGEVEITTLAEEGSFSEPAELFQPATFSQRLQALQDGRYPAQLAGPTGDIDPNRYGPQRNDPSEGIPRYAYSPFDERHNREYPCPAGGCEFEEGQILIKLAPQVEVLHKELAGMWSTDENLNLLMHAQGIQKLEAVFPDAVPPKAGEMILDPDGRALPKPDLTRWYKTTLNQADTVDLYMVIDLLTENEAVSYAEPNYLRRPTGIPQEGNVAEIQSELTTIPNPESDPLFSQQWHLEAANITAAWQWLEDEGYAPGGSHDVIVAVIDTGVDYTHPDLAASMWINWPEYNGIPGVDDDGNGYIDDIHGINAVSGQRSGDPMDDHGHGTHVAGIIAAQANNSLGGVGVAYNVQIMAIKAAQYSGVLNSADIAEGIYYAVAHGADIINMSFGGYARSQVEEDALAVAFGQAVLVAAAGNDARVNLPCDFGRDMYPAAYNWVLGVMAHMQNSDVEGNFLASFSNYDCNPNDMHEYELMAPGVEIWSTLPNENFASWSGTSMAAPVVSGIAALVRTRWSDKQVYSSRFIMGQIAATGPTLQAYVPIGSPAVYYHIPDALAALTTSPQPELSYLQHWLFDTPEIDPFNDNDGIVDAGETIDLAIVIRNHWGRAEPVIVTLEAWAEGAYEPDPFVTMIADTVDYGAIGAFNWKDNGLIYEDGVIVGVEQPFRFTTDPNTPNDHIIPFRLTITAGNGSDPDDPTEYTYQSRFYLLVQRGQELPFIIDEDMVLSNDYYWLVSDASLIAEGATVTVTEGTQLQFFSADPDDPYSQNARPYLQVEGTLQAQGTAVEPVEMFTGLLYQGYPIQIHQKPGGRTELQFVRITNPALGTEYNIFTGGNQDGIPLDFLGHVYLIQDLYDCISPFWNCSSNPIIRAEIIQNSIFNEIGYYQGLGKRYLYLESPVSSSLFDSSVINLRSSMYERNVFLKNYKYPNIGDTYWISRAESGSLIHEPSFLRFAFPTEYEGKTYVAIARQINTFSVDSWLYLDMVEVFANQLGGHVVAINDADENQFLVDYRNNVVTQDAFNAMYPDMDCGSPTYGGPSGGCWQLFSGHFTIGLTNRNEEREYRWLSGDPLDFTNWEAGEPNELLLNRFVRMNYFGGGEWKVMPYIDSPLVIELPGEVHESTLESVRQQMISEGTFNTFTKNAILNDWWDPDINHWMRFFMTHGRDHIRYITNNYWNTTSTTLLNAAIHDFYDDFNLGVYQYQPLLTTPPETAYPFVVNVQLSTYDDPDASVVGAELVTFTVIFNRDMDLTIQPQVSFGPDIPFTDFSISGDWIDARTWQGAYTITPVTGDGYHLMRVAGAVAADDPWLVTGNDYGRFRFQVETSGTAAMNLQATGGEGYVDLMWTQSDFDLLAGFNLYRALTLNGEYTRLNSSILPPDQRDYRDTEVIPGQPYYYKFTVVMTDMSESDFSNVAMATPLDTIPPVIEHTPITSAPPGLPLTLHADVTDNVAVESVTLFYRAIGAETYTSKIMVHTTDDRYSATLEGSLMVSPGVEYYIQASDGVNIVRSGRPDNPHQIIVVDQPVVILVTPNYGPVDGGTTVTISGSNFKPGADVTFGGAACADVTVISSNQITCATPPHFPATVDVTVINPDDQSGTLLGGFTYQSGTASLGMPDTGGGQYAIVQVPVNLANVTGLAAASLTVTFDQEVLSALDASVGNLTPGWSIAVNVNTPGEIRLSMASGGGTVSGSGVLALITFDVIGAPGASTVLHPTEISLNDGAIPVESADGSFTIDQVYIISGSTPYWNEGVVSGTLLTLTGNQVYTAVSDVNGQYAIANVPAGDYILVPSKANDVDGISAYDASLALQHDAGLITLSGHAFEAADVNRNGSVTSMDAYYILQHSAGLLELPFPGAGAVWIFDPPNRGYTDLNADQSGQDFTAILLGDPSGNWSPEGGGSLSDKEWGGLTTLTATVSLPYVDMLPEEQAVVPLMLTLPEGSLYAVDLLIAYDPAVITITQVGLGELAEGWSIASNLSTPGEVRVAMAGATPILESGELLIFDIQAVGESGEESILAITQVDLNEGGIPADTEDGQVRIAYPVEADFIGEPLAGPAPLTVVFTNTSSGDYDIGLWDFGDGHSSGEQSPIHTYEEPGVYTVTLTVSGVGGENTLERIDYIEVSTLSISGDVLYWEASMPVSGTTLTLEGEDVYSSTSGMNGSYQINGVFAGDYTLTPYKDDGVNGISAYDASLVLQHAADLINLEGHAAIAADVNRSGVISSLDASYILQKVVGLVELPFPGADMIWYFDPEDRTYVGLNSSVSGQDFTAILLGDPSGNWSPEGGGSLSDKEWGGLTTLTATVSLPYVDMLPEEQAVVPLMLTLPEGSLYAVDLLIAYDPAVITITQVGLGELAEGWSIASNLNTPGEVRVAMAGETPILESGELIIISIQADGADGAETVLTLPYCDLNENYISTQLEDGFVRIKDQDGSFQIYLPMVMGVVSSQEIKEASQLFDHTLVEPIREARSYYKWLTLRK